MSVPQTWPRLLAVTLLILLGCGEGGPITPEAPPVASGPTDPPDIDLEGYLSPTEYLAHWESATRISTAAANIHLLKTAPAQVTLVTQGEGPTDTFNPIYYVNVVHKLGHSVDTEAHWDQSSLSQPFSSGLSAVEPNDPKVSTFTLGFSCSQIIAHGSVSTTSQHQATWDVTVNPIGEGEPNAQYLTIDRSANDASMEQCPVESQVEQRPRPTGGSEPEVRNCYYLVYYWKDTGEPFKMIFLYCDE